MRKIGVISGWALIIAYMAVSLSFVDRVGSSAVCQQVGVIIHDSLLGGFVTQKEIRSVVNKHYDNIIGTKLSDINTETLEKVVLQNRAVKQCYVYKTVDGSVNVELRQRQPVLRVFDAHNNTFYLDDEGYIIPFSSLLAPNVIIANGNIRTNKPINIRKHHHINDFNISGKKNVLRDLLELTNFINNDPFWKAQFIQIYVDKKGEIELIPRVGAHIIVLGNINDYEEKFFKLRALYVKGLNNIGWNHYEQINLKYKNQVVCTKR